MRTRRFRHGLVLPALVGACLCLSGCAAPDEALDTGAEPAETAASPSATSESSAQPRWAERFRVEERDDGVLLTVFPPWSDPAEPSTGVTYALVSGEESSGSGAARTIRVPVERLVTTSTTELSHLTILGAEDLLVGHSEHDYVSSPTICARIDAGLVAELGGGSGLHPELLLDIEPGAVFADFLARSELDRLAVVEQAGVPIVLVPSFLETHPLGRAEWIVVTGLLIGRAEEARRAFDEVEARYLDLQRRVADRMEVGDGGVARDGPTIVTGGPWNDVWHVPGGRSFTARFLADAGGRYLWACDEATGALALDIETVYERALEADVWLHPSHWTSLDEIRAADPRLADLGPWRRGTVWANDARVGPAGGNDFWESGVSRPDLVLADLVKIFHPELVPEHELVYHRRLDTER